MQRTAMRMSEFLRATRTGDPATGGVVASQPWWVVRTSILAFVVVAAVPVLIVFLAASVAAAIVFVVLAVLNAIGTRLGLISRDQSRGRENVRVIPPERESP